MAPAHSAADPVMVGTGSGCTVTLNTVGEVAEHEFELV